MDGHLWRSLGAKQIPATWPQNLLAGATTVSTSEAEFASRFSQLTIVK
jgi:hypothetical protein